MITPRSEPLSHDASRRSTRAHLGRVSLSCLVLLALVFLRVTAAASGAASPGKAGYVEDYCAKTNPSYPIEVWWGKPPAWYCTDDLANPSKSIPFSPAAACASAGFGPPDASKFGVASYVICGTATPPTTPMYTVSGTVSYQGCPSAAGCSLRPPAVIVSIWTGTLVAKTTVSGAGNFKLRIKKGRYTIQADPTAYSGWGTKPPGIRTLRLTHDVSGVTFVVYRLRAPAPCAEPNRIHERINLGDDIGGFEIETFVLGESPAATSSGGVSGVTDVRSLSLTKYIDKSSPKLLQATANGKNFP